MIASWHALGLLSENLLDALQQLPITLDLLFVLSSSLEFFLIRQIDREA